jgi:YHS domain-containing protein
MAAAMRRDGGRRKRDLGYRLAIARSVNTNQIYKTPKTSKDIKIMSDFKLHRLMAVPAGIAVIALALAFASPAPAADVKGEFDDQCAMGLASGQNVKTDCSVNWTDEDGHVYCFSSDASKEAFLKDPAGNIKKAKEFLASKQAAKAAGAKDFTEDDVNKRVEEVVTERSKDGAFVFHDPKLDADLNLVFEQVKGVRGMEGYGWFANAIFHDKDEAKKQYAIDFWFKPDGDKLTLMDIRVQKGPKADGDSYYMVTRMPVAWWWLPVQEHPGDMEVRRAWHVMSAIHNYIATNKDENGNLVVKDDKTGESVPLEFVEMHQPIRHMKKDGQYFACTDFRKPGSKDEYYDIDFWVDDKDGKLQVANVKMHKVPVQEDGIWTQVPRYTFDGMDFDVTN